MMTEPAGIAPLFTDLYELTMAAGYFDHGKNDPATFSLFARHTPKRGYFVAAGLADALSELAAFRFKTSEMDYLAETRLFSDDFLSFLKALRFTGDVHAMAEGTIFFPNEPVLEVTAPLIEAQLIETFLLNTIGFQTLIATKAARCVHAAQGRPLVDFSLRRTQGADAGLKVARAGYLAGFDATSNVLAGKTYGIPTSGTMAHSFVTVFEHECAAFRAFAESFPQNSVFLIDTYDTLDGARHAVQVAEEMRQRGQVLKGVRLDSGNMIDLSQKVRRILNDAGFFDVKIFASSGFDEFKIAEVLTKGAAIDAFGVGTKMGVSADLPYLDVVYKLVRFKDRDVRKLSPGKVTLAGEKQVFRKTDERGRFLEDLIGLRSENLVNGFPLLQKVMEKGRVSAPLPGLQASRDAFRNNFGLLDEKYKRIEHPAAYPVHITRLLAERQPDP
jgi:nicotinate phosphoribosyltransferase